MMIKNLFTKILTIIRLFFSISAHGDTTEKILELLSNSYGVSGFEHDVRSLLIKYWKEQKINFEIDGMGNLVGKFPS